MGVLIGDGGWVQAEHQVGGQPPKKSPVNGGSSIQTPSYFGKGGQGLSHPKATVGHNKTVKSPIGTCMIPPVRGIKGSENQRDEKWISGCQGLGEQAGGVIVSWIQSVSL